MIAAIAAVVLVLMVWAPGKPAAVRRVETIGEPVRVSPHAGADEDPSVIRRADGTYLLAWTSPRNGTADIWLAESSDGSHWSSVRQATTGLDDDFYPSLVELEDGTLWLAWFRINAATRDADIWTATSTDGASWSAPVPVSPQPGIDWAPRLSRGPTAEPWLVWASERAGDRDVWESTRAIGVWTAPQRLTIGADADDFPTLTFSGGRLRLAFTRYDASRGDWTVNPTTEILVKESTDGRNWTNPVLFSTDSSSRYIDALPAWFERAGRSWIAWTSSRADPMGEILVAPVDSFASFRAATDRRGAPDYSPSVAPTDSPDGFVLAWVGVADGDMEILVARIGVGSSTV